MAAFSRKKIQTVMNGKTICVYPAETLPAPLVICTGYENNDEQLLMACQKNGCPEFSLVYVTNVRWEEELSPWKAEKIFSDRDTFAGEADTYLTFLVQEILPYTSIILKEQITDICIAGYSMAGLFSLYALYRTPVFSQAVCVSGSVWYPDFTEFCEKTEMKSMPETIYLSIGDRERYTKNPYVKQVEERMKTLYELFKRQNRRVCFEKNPGNHFKEADIRLAKGIQFALTDRRQH